MQLLRKIAYTNSLKMKFNSQNAQNVFFNKFTMNPLQVADICFSSHMMLFDVTCNVIFTDIIVYLSDIEALQLILTYSK